MSATMIDRAKVEAAFVVFSTVFDLKLSNTPVIYPQISTVIPGVSERIEFKWLSSIPTLKRWSAIARCSGSAARARPS